MTAIEPLLSQPVAQAIGWALLQFIWQGALIGIFTAAALAALRRSEADVRYVVAAIALSLMMTIPVVTAVQTWRTTARDSGLELGTRYSRLAARDSGLAARDETGDRAAASPAAGEKLAASIASSTPTPHEWTLNSWLPLLVLLWMAGVAVLTLRLLSGWLWVQHLKTHGAKAATDALRDAGLRLVRRLHITRTVVFLQSTIVDVPTVIGWLRPVVLVPTSALAGLAPHQLEAILAHELAHIRRHDYLVNLLQTLVETLLFYHPAVWWLSRRIRIERENCCDDLAVSLCGDPVTYARALADLEQLRGEARHFALAATGGSLLHRVRRLLGAPSHAGRGPGWLAASVVVLLMAGLTAGAVGNVLGSEQPPVVAAATGWAEGGSTAPRSELPLPHITSEHAREVEERARALAEEAAKQATRAESGQAVAAEAVAKAEAAVQSGASAVSSDRKSSGNFTWSNGKHKLQVNYRGAIEFTDDDKDIKSISPGGWLQIKEVRPTGDRSVEFRADESGRLERRFWVGPSERPFEPEGRLWLAESLPRFIRQTAIGASGRVARILSASGPTGVLAEISLIEGSWAKRIYFNELLERDLDQRTIEQSLGQAGREIDSDFELASLLIQSADRLLTNDGTKKAYFDAARSIGSDFEMRRVYSAALQRGTVSPDLLATLLDASTAIDSDFEQASLLIQIAKLQPLDGRTRPPFFRALDTVGSDFEHRRVLSALAARGDLAADTAAPMFESAAAIDSDFEQASLLLQMLERSAIEGSLRAPFFRVVDAIDSSFERGRVLKALAKRSELSAETVVGILRAAQGMESSFETAQVLVAVAANHPLSGDARSVYIDTAERLGDFEQGRVLAVLVRNERGKGR